jgi:phospholipase D1/2
MVMTSSGVSPLLSLAPSKPQVKSQRRLIVYALVGIAVIAAAVLAWKFTPLAELARPQVLIKHIESVADHRWAPLIFLAAYLLGGFVAFPVTVLGAAVAIIFPPWKAIPISFTGIILSAALHHWIGARFLKSRDGARLGSVRKRIEEMLTDQSIVTIAALRMVPIAPFVLVNVVAGCMGVKRRDFLLGTALGLAPSITVICLFGRQVRQFWKDPSVTGVAMIVGVAVVWLGVAIGLQKWVSHRKNRG